MPNYNNKLTIYYYYNNTIQWFLFTTDSNIGELVGEILYLIKVLHSVLQCYTVAVLHCSSVSLDMANYGVRLLYDMLLVIIATSMQGTKYLTCVVNLS